MTPIALLALLGIALFLPVFMSDDDADVETPEEPEVPEEPLEPTSLVIEGTAEADTLNGNSGEIVNAGEGNDTLTVTENAALTTLNGDGGDDLFDLGGDGNSDNTVARGGAGNDVITAGQNHINFTANGEGGDDTITVDSDGDSAILGGNGDDRITFGGDVAQVSGGEGDDFMTLNRPNSFGGTDSAMTVTGDAGNDFIGIGRSNLTAEGGEGNDQIRPGYSASDPWTGNTLDGGAGDDTLIANGTDNILLGGDGEDLLRDTFFPSTQNANVLDGGAGDDVLESRYFIRGDQEAAVTDTLTGGTGSDLFDIEIGLVTDNPAPSTPVATITDFNPDEDRLRIDVASFAQQGGYQDVTLVQDTAANSTDIILRFANPDGVSADTTALIRLEGVTGLTEDDLEIDDGRDVIEGTAGNDTLSSTDADDDSFRGIDTLRGLAGDDVLVHEASDSSGPLVLEGGEGNDTLVANEVEFGQQTTLNGGAGDDVLRSDNFIPRGNGAFDTFITGEGADRIEITTFNVGSNDNIDLGLIGLVTDFTPGEDMIFVDPSQLVREVVPDGETNGGEDFVAEYTQEFSLREDQDGAFTDLEFTYTAIGRTLDGDPVQMTGIIRLEGLTNLTEDDIAFAQLETQAPLFVRSGVAAGI
ncbi:calcium-binding protein [uncultured Sulfitobacter sp.]|uniref:calcium-binding protein n=1 Tax=uncultured Sulfitobacter sp. TaxID=191468 RepID=UPI002621956A|nr:calcium-binding protein [uncultured Sulfitobacter sp.]